MRRIGERWDSESWASVPTPNTLHASKWQKYTLSRHESHGPSKNNAFQLSVRCIMPAPFSPARDAPAADEPPPPAPEILYVKASVRYTDSTIPPVSLGADLPVLGKYIKAPHLMNGNAVYIRQGNDNKPVGGDSLGHGTFFYFAVDHTGNVGYWTFSKELGKPPLWAYSVPGIVTTGCFRGKVHGWVQNELKRKGFNAIAPLPLEGETYWTNDKGEFPLNLEVKKFND